MPCLRGLNKQEPSRPAPEDFVKKKTIQSRVIDEAKQPKRAREQRERVTHHLNASPPVHQSVHCRSVSRSPQAMKKLYK